MERENGKIIFHIFPVVEDDDESGTRKSFSNLDEVMNACIHVTLSPMSLSKYKSIPETKCEKTRQGHNIF